MPNRIIREGYLDSPRVVDGKTIMAKFKRVEVPLKLRRKMWREPCAVCGGTFRIRIDHIVPVSKGGKTEIANLQPLCWQCNHIKGAKLISNVELWEIVRRRCPLHYAIAAYKEATQYGGGTHFHAFVHASYSPEDAKKIIDQYERRDWK